MKNHFESFRLFSLANCKRCSEELYFEFFQKINCLHEMRSDTALRVMLFLHKVAMYPISSTDIMHLTLPPVSEKALIVSFHDDSMAAIDIVAKTELVSDASSLFCALTSAACVGAGIATSKLMVLRATSCANPWSYLN